VAATHRAEALGALRAHDGRRLDGGDVAVDGLIGAGAPSDVQHGPRIPERSPDLLRDPGLGTPGQGVGGPMLSYNGALDMTGLPNVDSNGT